MILGICDGVVIQAGRIEPLIGVTCKSVEGGAQVLLRGIRSKTLKPVAVQAREIVGQAHETFQLAKRQITSGPCEPYRVLRHLGLRHDLGALIPVEPLCR